MLSYELVRMHRESRRAQPEVARLLVTMTVCLFSELRLALVACRAAAGTPAFIREAVHS